MNRRRGALAAVAVVAVLAARGRAMPMPQARDAVTRVGTGVLAGIVVTDEPSPRPIRHATVMLSSGNVQFPLSTLTDDAGRFTFSNLPAGNYLAIATKPGYVSTTYGSRRPGRGPGVPIAVIDGQRVDDISLRMLHGGVITGTVRNASGQPAFNQTVNVLQVESTGGGRRLAPVAMAASTDDRGVYRAYGLAPGDYVVQIHPSFVVSAAQGDTRLVTAAELRWADQTSVQAAGALPAPMAPPEAAQTVAYADVYYPGTAEVTPASIVSIGPGETREGIDITMSFVPTARLTGTVLDPDGRPRPGAVVSTSPAEAMPGLLDFVSGFFASGTSPSGSFLLTGVTPGTYRINVRATPLDATGRGGAADPAAMLMRRLGANVSTPTLWATMDVTVDGRDLTDLVLRLQPGMTVSGKIVFESSAVQPPDFTRANVALMEPPKPSSAMELAVRLMMGAKSVTISPDGTFAAKGVTPGNYRVTTGGLGLLLNQAAASGWTLKSALLDGRDVADTAFEVRPNEDVTGIVVTLTDRPTELSGAVTDSAGRPAPGYPIVVFSTDRAYWTVASRRVRQIRPSSDGRYKVTGLPAGGYYMCALTDLDQNQLYDPSFLESLLPGSFKISIADGEKKTQDLKLAGGG